MAYTSLLPENYMAVASVGYGVSAILLNLLEFVFLAVGSNITEQQSFIRTNIYYAISAAILLLAGMLYFVQRKN